VIKIFALMRGGIDSQTQEELSRDASNARHMAKITGGLGVQGATTQFLAPGSFRTTRIDAQTVPYLVTPYYPSGSIRQFLRTYSHPLSLDWCLSISQQMFLACAELARAGVVSCDAKLANFVFAPGCYEPSLSSEAMDAIARGAELPANGPPTPVVKMIDLSMIYDRKYHHDDDRNTRRDRGTPDWSSPRAFGGYGPGDGPFPLTSLDDAFTIAVNTMFLFTERTPPYKWGSRVSLEALAHGDPAAEARLRELSQTLAIFADDTSTGPTPDHLLGRSRAWCSRSGVRQSEACEAAARYIGHVRESLPVPVRQQTFREIPFVPNEAQ
jgi:serine/threonine protein kinase